MSKVARKGKVSRKPEPSAASASPALGKQRVPAPRHSSPSQEVSKVLQGLGDIKFGDAHVVESAVEKVQQLTSTAFAALEVR